MAEMITRVCPHCGKELQVPEELQEFSCLYCGQRITLETAPLDAAPEGDKLSAEEAAATVEALRPRLLGSVTRYPENCEKLAKKHFFVTFEAYENDNRGLMKEVDALLRQHPAGREEAAQLVCGNMIADLEEYILGAKRGKRGTVIFEVKVVLAIFLTPMVRKMKLETAELFRETLHKCWKEKFPKDVWYPGDYEVLEKGYKKRKLCYITTATCRHEGKADDCAELTAFRAFRDGWLTEQGDTALIEDYYEKAPGLVACLELCDEAEPGYRSLREDYLKPCYEALQRGDNEACRSRYIQMVKDLEAKYSH